MDTFRLKLHALVSSLANNLASPFVSYNVTEAGGSNILIGYLQSIGTLTSAIAQVVGGRLVDRTGRRLRLAMILSVAVGVIWIEAAAFQGTEALTVSYTAVTIALGFYLAGWNSFLGEATGKERRGSFLATFARISSWGAFAALVLTTIVTFVTPSYTLLFILSGMAFVSSALFLRGQSESEVNRESITRDRNNKLNRYYAFTGVYGLFWGFAWPLFTITTVKIVKMTLVEYSFATLIGVGSTIAFQTVVGRMVDRDRKRSVLLGRLGLVAYPVCYMFFTQSWEIYAINIYSGFTNSLLNVAYSAYLYDLAPVGRRGRYIAEFNLVTGVTTIVGSLASAELLTVLNSGLSMWSSLACLYIVATLGRLAAALLHLRLD